MIKTSSQTKDTSPIKVISGINQHFDSDCRNFCPGKKKKFEEICCDLKISTIPKIWIRPHTSNFTLTGKQSRNKSTNKSRISNKIKNCKILERSQKKYLFRYDKDLIPKPGFGTNKTSLLIRTLFWVKFLQRNEDKYTHTKNGQSTNTEKTTQDVNSKIVNNGKWVIVNWHICRSLVSAIMCIPWGHICPFRAGERHMCSGAELGQALGTAGKSVSMPENNGKKR